MSSTKTKRRIKESLNYLNKLTSSKREYYRNMISHQKKLFHDIIYLNIQDSTMNPPNLGSERTKCPAIPVLL